jgi:hypothetical protein
MPLSEKFVLNGSNIQLTLQAVFRIDITAVENFE